MKERSVLFHKEEDLGGPHVSHLGVVPAMGFSMASFMTMPETEEMTTQMMRKRHQKFLADMSMGISHIPIRVTSCNNTMSHR